MRPRSQTSIEAADANLDAATELADVALDALLAAPSRSSSDFAGKLRALEAEYGCEWQPHHMRALMADCKVLVGHESVESPE